jgi:hypothetical protein
MRLILVVWRRTVKQLSTLEVHCAVAILLGSILATPQGTVAQTHVVPQAQIQRDLATSSTARQRNEQQLKSLLSMPEMQQAMKSKGIDAQQVTSAISQLNNADLAQLAARSAKAQKDFAAGDITNRDLLLILLGAAVLILIIVAVR